ncbi:hypothetical protein Bca52824_047985 [Brassica carinata]|uniref:Agenet domain-containing protein n=1 Tax=Brassica carinata TaxID=52824 RepID=A0A8X7UTU3_BRACI|nr:hypothetical protein Bca52824_047985 [Brassica carinata]
MNEGVVFKEGSVVDAYFNNGWWTGVIVVERSDGSFFVYFDEPPDIMRFIRSQLRPHADWIGYKWVKSKNKVLSQHMFRTGKLVEMTREISDSEKEKIGCTSSQNSSDEAEGKHSIVDICKIRPSPPRDLCAEYSLNHIVEVVVTHGWRKGRVTEIFIENNYKVYFDATKEDAVFNYTEIRMSMEWLGGVSWIHARKVDVKCILGDPEMHSDLVEDVDSEFGRRQDWLNGSVDIAVAEAEVDENNSAPGIDATDQEQIEFLTKKVNADSASCNNQASDTFASPVSTVQREIQVHTDPASCNRQTSDTFASPVPVPLNAIPVFCSTVQREKQVHTDPASRNRQTSDTFASPVPVPLNAIPVFCSRGAGKAETVERYRALLRLSNEHRLSEIEWHQAASKANSIASQIELLEEIIKAKGKFDFTTELEKLKEELMEADGMLADVKVKVPDRCKLEEKWLLDE